MVICIASEKGGVGKTSLAYSLAKDLNLDYITNDTSIVTNIYKKAKYIPNRLTLRNNTLYDFGGFKSEQAYLIIEKSDILLIPTTFDSNSIMKTVQIFKKFPNKYKIIIANMIENDKEKNQITAILKKHLGKNVNILYMKRNKLLKNAIESGYSARELINLDKRNQYLYKKSFNDYQKILKIIKE